MTGKPMPDDKFREFMNTAVNVWFKKWKSKSGKMTDSDWGSCIEECSRIMVQNEQYHFAESIMMDLLWELEARDKHENL